MNTMKWNKISVTIPYSVGQLSSKRLENIAKGLNSGGMEVNATINPNPKTVIFLINSGKANIILQENQLSYTTLINDQENFMTSIKENFLLILNTLMIDDNNQCVFNLEGNSETENSHSESKTLFEKKYGRILTEDVFGVGYRFLLESKNYSGEFKVEPWIADCRIYYYQLIINTKTIGSFDTALGVFQESLKNKKLKDLVDIKE